MLRVLTVVNYARERNGRRRIEMLLFISGARESRAVALRFPVANGRVVSNRCHESPRCDAELKRRENKLRRGDWSRSVDRAVVYYWIRLQCETATAGRLRRLKSGVSTYNSDGRPAGEKRHMINPGARAVSCW